MYKLIAIDLDGTLLNENKEITKENLKVINKAIEKGYDIAIATGRRYWSAKDLTRNINSHLTIFANNGNMVRNSSDDKEIISKYLDPYDYRIIVEEGRKRNLNPIIHFDGYHEGFDIAIEKDKDYKGYYNYLSEGNRFKIINNYLDIEDKILTLVYPGKKQELDEFYLHINKAYPNMYNSHIMENMVLSEALLEIMNPAGTKWLSILEYAKQRNINPEEIIAIGDNNNDIAMIKGAGLGIAMINGSQSIKKVADRISELDNNESGVAFELKRVLNI